MFGRPRRARKAKATIEISGYLVQFIPGGFYHLKDGALFTGVHHRAAAYSISQNLLPLAIKAANSPGKWVTK